jgi:hypothetical protein
MSQAPYEMVSERILKSLNEGVVPSLPIFRLRTFMVLGSNKEEDVSLFEEGERQVFYFDDFWLSR